MYARITRAHYDPTQAYTGSRLMMDNEAKAGVRE
jgi:hypothetical protein